MAKQITRAILDRAWRRGRLSIELVCEMEEAERRRTAELLPAAHQVGSERKVALFDMDGVLLDGRFVMNLAERLGIQKKLRRFLDNKSLSDEERTRAIAALFAGVEQRVFEDTARSMPLMNGAVETVVALRKAGYMVGIVTDSFQVAAQIVRRRVFADFSVAHLLHFRNRLATGETTLSPMMLDPGGCQWHSCCKANVLRHLRDSAGFAVGATLAVGDNDNDICMLGEVGTSIAFRPKSVAVAEAAQYSLRDSLTEVLDLLALPTIMPRIRQSVSPQATPLSVASGVGD
jgi:phosphoserine phosphatase